MLERYTNVVTSSAIYYYACLDYTYRTVKLSLCVVGVIWYILCRLGAFKCKGAKIRCGNSVCPGID
jgi:hypothetical protein